MKRLLLFPAFFVLFALLACGGGDEAESEPPPAAATNIAYCLLPARYARAARPYTPVPLSANTPVLPDANTPADPQCHFQYAPTLLATAAPGEGGGPVFHRQ